MWRRHHGWLWHHGLEGRGHGLHVRQGGVGLRRAPQLELPRLLAEGASEAPEVRAAVVAGLGLEVVRLPYARPRLVGQARDEAKAEGVEPEERAAVRHEVPDAL